MELYHHTTTEIVAVIFLRVSFGLARLAVVPERSETLEGSERGNVADEPAEVIIVA
jgi:hypothetical protein